MLYAIKRRFRRFIAKIYDPLVDLTIGTKTIKVPLSHQLRDNIVIYPDYNFNLPRIISYLVVDNPTLTVIDIGANIGDTVAFIKNHSDVPVLCIDGEEKYIGILKANVAQYTNVAVCHALVGESTHDSNVQLKMERGTAFVAESSETTKVRSLYDILKDYPTFRDSKVLKIDTDGYDTLILRGAAKYLTQVKPVLFFEYDPYLISKSNDNPFEFFTYLKLVGYQYLMFYVNNGDFLLSCDLGNVDLVNQLVHYFSGRGIAIFADVCAFAAGDKANFDYCVAAEIEHFKKARNY